MLTTKTKKEQKVKHPMDQSFIYFRSMTKLYAFAFAAKVMTTTVKAKLPQRQKEDTSTTKL